MTGCHEAPRKRRGGNRAGLSFKERNLLALKEPSSAKMNRTDLKPHGLR